MRDDWIRWVLSRFSRPPLPEPSRVDLDDVEIRLDALERKQEEIDARIALVEQQADPRGIWRRYE